MYLNGFFNMTNMFSHEKIVYRDLGTAKIKKNTTGTTEKCLIVSSVSEWMCLLMYKQPCNVECCLVSLVAPSVSAPHLVQEYIHAEVLIPMQKRAFLWRAALL